LRPGVKDDFFTGWLGGESSWRRSLGQVLDMSEAPSLRLLKPQEVARRLGVSRSWVYNAAADGRIPAIRLGGPDGPLRFVPEDLERWIAEARDALRPSEVSGAALRRAARRTGG
jgi:excisionase family DNA binding protein